VEHLNAFSRQGIAPQSQFVHRAHTRGNSSSENLMHSNHVI
jgi:hypothetical protein